MHRVWKREITSMSQSWLRRWQNRSVGGACLTSAENRGRVAILLSVLVQLIGASSPCLNFASHSSSRDTFTVTPTRVRVVTLCRYTSAIVAHHLYPTPRARSHRKALRRNVHRRDRFRVCLTVDSGLDAGVNMVVRNQLTHPSLAT